MSAQAIREAAPAGSCPPARQQPAAERLNVFGELTVERYREQFAKRGIVTRPFSRAVHRSAVGERHAIERYLREEPDVYVRELSALADALPTLDPECRMAVLIPCRFEEKRIGGGLGAVTRQSASASQRRRVEVTVLDNHYASERPDGTETVVREFSRAQPDAPPIRYLRKAFSPDEAHFGLSLARKMLADVTLLRALRRPKDAPALYLASLDADVVDIDHGTFADIIQKFDDHPWVDAVRGIQDRQPEIMCENSLLFLERRAWYFAEKLLSAKRFWPDRNPHANFTWHRNVTGGWNTFFSAAVYAEIGGYSRLRFLEDIDIGNRISIYRGRLLESGAFRPDVRSIVSTRHRMDSSPVRFIHALLNELDPYSREDGYDNFFSQETDRVVKNNDLAALLSRLGQFDDPRGPNQARFDNVLVRVLRALLDIDPEHGEVLFRRVMFFLGFSTADYLVESGAIEVLSYDRFRERVASFRQRVSR